MSLKQENLVQTSVQYKAGQRLVKVGSSFLPVGFGGNFEPGKGGGTVSSSMKFYKCASVDTENKTWTGYELVLEDGVYIVSDTLTNDLAYIGFTPVVGTTYNEDTTLTIGTLFSKSETLEGCVFAANMQTTSATYNGETVNLDGITLADAPGYTDGTKALVSVSGEDLNYPVNGATDFSAEEITVSLSAYWNIGGASTGQPYFVELNCGSYFYLMQEQSAGSYVANGTAYIGREYVKDSNIQKGWHNFTFTYAKGTVNWYKDGVLFRTWSSSFSPSSITAIATRFRYAINAHMKDLQIYSRVLSEEEIATLYEKAKLPTGV